MLNINELESRWLTYKIKSYIPHAVIALSVVVIGIAATSLDFSTQEQESLIVVNKQEVVPIEDKTVQERVVIVPPIITKKEKNTPKKNYSQEENTQQVIQPSLGFLHNIKGDSPDYYQDDTTPVPNAQSYKAPKKTQEPKKVFKKYVEKVKEEKVKVPTVQASTISIQRQNTYQDVQHVIKRFKKSNNPALSLFVAKKYYELNNYQQAYNYALITNELNSDIEDSWIIFAKSLVKLNKKKRAISILRKYIANAHSQRAEILLNSIKAGKMK